MPASFPHLSPFLRIRRARCLAAILPALSGALTAQPGLDGPEAIGPYLNGNFPPTDGESAGEWTIRETYPGVNVNLPMHVTPYPGTDLLACVAKEGRIVLFEDDAGTTETDTLLDISHRAFTSSDSGMGWMVFHPEFGETDSPSRGYIYVTYKWRPDESELEPGAGDLDGGAAYWRLSRFTVPDGDGGAPDGTTEVDPESEQVLIQQLDRQEWHDSGCMAFGPDGYLYVAAGDEGGANDEYNVAQRIDQRLLSGILRIDVDMGPDSHAIRRQPAQTGIPDGWPEAFTAHYRIPDDNPFLSEDGENLEEFYAIGLRQPYRIFFDEVSGRTWIGESGQDTSEELSLLEAGANYGWPVREGSVAGPKPNLPLAPGTLTEPVWDVLHASGPDGCIVAGGVYRGEEFPELVGKIITVDNVSGRIRALTYDEESGEATDEILTDMPSGSVYRGTSTIGHDHAGEPIFVKIDGTNTPGRFYKLDIAEPTITTPVWYRFENRPEENTSGYLTENPDASVESVLGDGPALLAYREGTSRGTNARYDGPNGLVPTGVESNDAGVRFSRANFGGYPGNLDGDLYMESRFGELDDFTAELSFRPAAGSLDGGYQCFLGLNGTTGEVPGDDEAGEPVQPFRLMRWGRDDDSATSIPLEDGDLIVNVRTYDEQAGQWTSAPVEVFDDSEFVTERWYHLAIVGDASAGTITVYSFEDGQYEQRGQATGYAGNLRSGSWSIGRGMYNGSNADWVEDARFDEFRLANRVIDPSEFLYAGQEWEPQAVATEPPQLLSETGAFTDLDTLTPASGIFPYDVSSPLWSDRAAKQRWIALPNDGAHDTPAEKIGFHPEKPWAFPAGTVFIKHFALPVDEADPHELRRLETRFIIISQSGEPYGLTYRWREDGSDAELLEDGLQEDVAIEEIGGGSHPQTWVYPSRSDCRVCHNENAGHVLGVKTWQLNGELTYDRTGRTANQLESFAALGWFDDNYHPEHLPYFLEAAAIDDESAPLGERVRAYIDSNCSQCHIPGGVRANFDARFTTPLAEQGLIRGALEAELTSPENRVVAPGDLENSLLYQRHASTGVIKMPPLAKNVVHDEAAQAIADWINGLPQAPVAEIDAPPGASGPFEAGVTFSEPVTGLEPGDFTVLGGTVGSLSGSDATYTLTVTPTRTDQLEIHLPEDAAQGADGEGNFASARKRVAITDHSAVTSLRLDDGTGSTAVDDSPMKNHGTLVDMEPGDWIDGRHGGALRFDDSAERVTIGNLAPDDFTISFWMRPDGEFPVTGNPPDGHAVIHADAPGTQTDFMIAGTNTGGVFRSNRISVLTGFGGDLPNYILHGNQNIPAGEWVHVAVTREQDSGAIAIYLNGETDITGTGSTATLDANPVISLGGNPEGAGVSYRGSLDEIRIHNRVLTSKEIRTLHDEQPGPRPYDRWIGERLPGLTHLHSMAADPEGDGQDNFAEFAFGGDPLEANIFPVPLERAEDGSVTLTFTARRTRTDVEYLVDVGEALGTWTDADPDITRISREDIADSDYERVTITYLPPAAADRLFFRVRATPR